MITFLPKLDIIHDQQLFEDILKWMHIMHRMNCLTKLATFLDVVL